MSQTISLFAAFMAGIVSFISPCVLPIVPGYLSFISGVNMADLKEGGTRSGLAGRVGLTALFFVLGFSTVFVSLGAAASLVGYYLQQYKRSLGIVGGVIIILLGLHTAGILPIKWLLYEKRADVKSKPMSLVGAYVVGLAFAFGWTPCIGPILGGILLYASQQETVGQGVALLTAYSAGLGIPFLISAFAINAFFGAFSHLKRRMALIEKVAGGLLVAVGLLLVTDQLTVLAQYFSKLFPGLAKIG